MPDARAPEAQVIGQVWRACRDECRLVFRDPGVLLITGAAVVIYSFFYPVPYSREVLRDIPVAIVDGDGSAMSRTYIRMLDAHEAVRVDVRGVSRDQAEDLVRRGTVAAAVVVPAGLERDVLRGRPVRLVAQVDASYMLAYGQVVRGLLETTGTLSAGVEMARLRAGGRTAEAATRTRQPLVADLHPLFSRSSGYGAYVVPAVLVLVLQQTLLIGAGMAGGTRWERLRAVRSGATPADSATSAADDPGAHAGWLILQVWGRAVPYLLLYAANTAYCFGFVVWYHGYPVQGTAASVALLAVPFLLATTMLALALRGLFQRRETAVQVLLFTSLPCVFLAGFSWPVEAVAPWLQCAARLVPTTSAIPAFLRVTRMGADLADVSRETTTLWILAALYLPLACLGEWRIARAGRRG